MKDQTVNNSDEAILETVLEQAWDDVTMLNNAVESWPTGGGNYESDYLLMVMTAQNARAESAFSLLQKLATTKEEEEIRELKTQFEKGHVSFLEILSEDQFDIEKMFEENGGLTLRLSEILGHLDRVVRVVEDGILFNNAEWLKDDLNEVAESFFYSFHDMARMQYLSPEALRKIASFRQWSNKFKQLEQKLKEKFSYLSLLKDMLQSIKQREYDQKEFWWLHDDPGEKPQISQVISVDSVHFLGKTVFPQVVANTESCPDQELLIAYALGDPIGSAKRTEVEAHVKGCRACLMIILETRAADAQANSHTVEDEAQGAKAVIGASDEDWKSVLTAIPAWQLLPEQKNVTIEFPDEIPAIDTSEDIPRYVPAVLAARPNMASLPLMHDTGNKPVVFAKLITVSDQEITSLQFVRFIISLSHFEKGKLYLSGTIKDFFPQDCFFLYCDWLMADGGTVVPAEKTVIKESTISVKFNFPQFTEKPDGEFRIMFVQKE